MICKITNVQSVINDWFFDHLYLTKGSSTASGEVSHTSPNFFIFLKDTEFKHAFDLKITEKNG